MFGIFPVIFHHCVSLVFFPFRTALSKLYYIYISQLCQCSIPQRLRTLYFWSATKEKSIFIVLLTEVFRVFDLRRLQIHDSGLNFRYRTCLILPKNSYETNHVFKPISKLEPHSNYHPNFSSRINISKRIAAYQNEGKNSEPISQITPLWKTFAFPSNGKYIFDNLRKGRSRWALKRSYFVAWQLFMT